MSAFNLPSMWNTLSSPRMMDALHCAASALLERRRITKNSDVCDTVSDAVRQLIEQIEKLEGRSIADMNEEQVRKYTNKLEDIAIKTGGYEPDKDRGTVLLKELRDNLDEMHAQVYSITRSMRVQKPLRPSVIRDFVYVDVDQLESLYSQIFQGVTDQIVESYIGISSHKSDLTHQPSDASREAKVAEAGRRTESKVLHDHMYSLLENSIADLLTDANRLDSNSVGKDLAEGCFIRVSGVAVIEDYLRLNSMIGNFNKLGESIAMSQMATGEMAETINNLKSDAAQIKNREARKQAERKLKTFGDPSVLAKKAGLYQDEKFLEAITFIAKLFRGDGIDITLSPHDCDVYYRGVLKDQFLRVSREDLRCLYLGESHSDWTMVGQVTSTPKCVADDSVENTTSDSSSMRDAMGNMFSTMSNLEKIFAVSGEHKEVIVSPLAIYKEITLGGRVRD